MAEAAKAQEPSMEEILASIRRIISEDEGSKPVPAAETAAARELPAQAPSPPEQPVAGPPGDSVLAVAPDSQPPVVVASSPDLRDAEAAPEADSADVLELTPAMELRKEERPAPPREKPRDEPVPAFRVIDARPDLVFSEAPAPQGEKGEAAGSPGFSLRDRDEPSRPEPGTSRPLLSDHATAAVTSAFGSLAHTVLAQNARTLEDLVGEMLRPMLKTWLDDNLPTIVERLVRAEIERVSRGRT